MNPFCAIRDRLCGAEYDLFIAQPRRDWRALPNSSPLPRFRKELAALNPWKVPPLARPPERERRLYATLTGVSAFIATVLAEATVVLVILACFGK